MTNVDGDVVGTPKELLDGIRFSEKYSSCGEVSNGKFVAVFFASEHMPNTFCDSWQARIR